MRALITAGTTAAAFRMKNRLDPYTEVVFGDNPKNPAPTVLSSTFICLPDSETETFIHEMLTLCLDHGITHVFPLRTGEISALRTAIHLFDEMGISVNLTDEDAV